MHLLLNVKLRVMNKIVFIFLVIVNIYARSCYSIKTDVGVYTPIYPYNFDSNQNRCSLLNKKIIFKGKYGYIGCFKTYDKAKNFFETFKFNYKNPQIVKHNVFSNHYIVFPKNANIQNVTLNLNKYKPQNIISKFPYHYYGNGISFQKISNSTFLPTLNAYDFYRFYKKHHLSQNIMILYNGVYSIDYLYKKINNSSILQKISKNKFILKIPIYISPTATLVVKNKTLLLETTPKPIFIMYNGKFYAKNSKFITWNIAKNSYDKREYIDSDKLLLVGLQKPRPYILGMENSKTYFVNNLFDGLGFHSLVATFGISLVSMSQKDNFNLSIFTHINNLVKPTGIYVGNIIKNNMIGFYSSNVKNVTIIGNLYYDNLIYDIDPHDYSTNFIIARNITLNAKNAHGIVVSRGVNHSIITQNISLNNNSTGIMLDRSSYNNIIYDNLSALNGYMGISIQESDNNLISNNIIIGNKIDGIIVRNSLKTTIKNNYIKFNNKNGIEVLTKSIADMIYRDFLKDPYHKASSAVVVNNKLINNSMNNILVKNNAAIYIENNTLENNIGINYGGELKPFLPEISDKFKLYGIGEIYKSISSDKKRINKKLLKEIIKLYVDASDNNDYVSNFIANSYLQLNDTLATKQEYIRGISQFNIKDMYEYGYLIISNAKTKQDYIKGLSYIAQSMIFSNQTAKYLLSQMLYILPVTRKDINLAVNMALDRLKQYKLVEDKYNVSYKLVKKDKLKIESVLKIFEYKFNHSNANDYYSYCKQSVKNVNIFTKNVVMQIENKFRQLNAKKIEYQLKQKYNKKYIISSKECLKTKRKLDRIEKSLNEYYVLNKNKILKEIKPYIDKYLLKVNQFRIYKISEDKIYKLMQEQK